MLQSASHGVRVAPANLIPSLAHEASLILVEAAEKMVRWGPEHRLHLHQLVQEKKMKSLATSSSLRDLRLVSDCLNLIAASPTMSDN